MCSFFLNEDSSFEVSVDGILEPTRDCRINNIEVCLQLCPGESVCRLQIGNKADFADSMSLIHTIASIGRLAHVDTSLLEFIREIRVL